MFVAGRLANIDARKPLTSDEVARIEAAMDRHAVIILSGQDIDDQQQLAFSRNFGPLEDGANSGASDSDLRLPVVFADVSNLDKDGKIAAEGTPRFSRSRSINSAIPEYGRNMRPLATTLGAQPA